MSAISGIEDMQSRERILPFSPRRAEGEEEWIQRLRSQDPDAFRELFRRECAHVYSVAHRLAPRRDDREDLVQETFLEVWKSLPGFRGNSSLQTWIHRVAVNTCLRHLRKQKWDEEPLTDEVADSQALEPAANPDRRLLQADLKQQVTVALEGLPAHHRQVIVLHELEGFTFREVARMLGIPVGTAKSRLFHGLRKLRELLRPYVCPVEEAGREQVMTS